jgi:hypothetical protein
MDTATLVTRLIDDGRKVLEHLAGAGVPERGACWLKEYDRSGPTYYFATPWVREKGTFPALRDVFAVLDKLENVWIDANNIAVVADDHPVARAVADLRARRRTGFQPPGTTMFGGLPVTEVYVYPAPDAVSGFSAVKERFPSAEMLVLDLPGEQLPPNWFFSGPVRALASKVNARAFAGRAPETLKFAGGRFSLDEKQNQLTFVYRPEGWNALLDPVTKEWKRVVFEGTSRSLYEPADFSPLEQLLARAEPVPA